MPYITAIGYCTMCGRKRVTFTDKTHLRCCTECYDWMIARGYPVVAMLDFAAKYWERENHKLQAGWDEN